MSPLKDAEAYLETVGLLDRPGKVLYSAEATLVPSPVYLLGLNPGGSEGATVRESLAQSRNGHNAYIDEQWSPGGHLKAAGTAPLQRRVQGLCQTMGLETRSVPASNLVFTRSTRLNSHADFASELTLCLPVHAIFLNAVQPQFLMTFGGIDNFRKAVAVLSMESRPAGHATWQAHRGRAIFCGRELQFANVPHLSLWASNLNPEVLLWAVERMKS
ncbi:hypothetical protein C8J35_11519 [Rhizobium sp. PP-F2F-G38]|uniref:hypothetical protein n=1 Tax=Rhizobium sp. PP-CC-3G-465 TaxID=2135648 RepID=UPI000D836C55|nr:hypothetical protein C8J37_12722 [Rhizobium sp. PP-WC-1G-195]PYE93250.1 hypothetical protein C8J35_11519 [Rhizobium sp. PP-F2F-G38]TCP75071.1 hypothetical protein C8J31_13418 [Rhizobium sp. PP-CC-2G-626]TCQ16173.1 hypothetical protein C8J33_1176 [Rhizobium sp. PP-CC-3G-465]